MPPPNETGTLHLGHALGLTIQDILARHARLKNLDVMWLPGTDHAALATNAIIEKLLQKEGTSKHDIGRQEFLKRTRQFVAYSRKTINSQIRAMGASADWSRARYTLDASLSRCVNEVFTKMYNDGLIYRGHRIVNWDPKLETNVSDDEVEYKLVKAKLYTLKYGPLIITTARPETKFGDKYVVMHPDDKRYSQYKHGDQFEVEWINGKLTTTVIKDTAVDPKFGSGVMTITPWHSQVDFEIAERHNLDKQQIIDLKGNLLDVAGEFRGMSIEQARPKIVEKLAAKGLVIDIEDNYSHNIALNSRGEGIIEPQIRLQWFIDVNKPAVNWRGAKLSFKQVMQSVIRQGDINLIPARFDKLYFHWVDNLRDWCISRQIWWGHQIPVWYRQANDNKEETYVGVLPPHDSDSKSKWQRDPDTLDTWFSSSLWTWSTLIDPGLADNYDLSLNELLQASPDFLAYHPTSVLDTGWDIIFFWVARMIMATTYVTGQIPFKNVYFHGLVLTAAGSKMSKSNPKTIVDPMEVIPQYGTDALRLALIQGMSAGNSQKLVKSKVVTNRNFCNKLWNVARYIERIPPAANSTPLELRALADHWILKQLILAKDQINIDLDKYRFSDAYSKLYHFLRDDFADWYIEASKVELNKKLLDYVLKNFLMVAHPMAPYVTEAIWQQLEIDGKSLLAGVTYHKLISHDEQKSNQFDQLKTLISETRQLLQGLGESKTAMSYLPNPLIDRNRTLIATLAKVSSLKPVANGRGLKLTDTNFDVWLDIDAIKARDYLARLEIKRRAIEQHIERLGQRLSNKSYVANAPEEVLTDSKTQLENYNHQLTRIVNEVKLYSSL